MDDFERPWHVGILWNGHDGALALPLIESLRAESGLCIGDNEPYDGRGDVGFTMQCHADPRGIPNVLIELRQDLIATEIGQHHWAGLIAQHLAPILADDSIYPAGPAG
jgi:predicted N-formylglutamate amidohydrolase